MRRDRPGAVLVTGASSGIGRATAEALARAGFTVLAGSRRLPDRGFEQRHPQGLEKAPGALIPVQLDVTDPSSIRRALELVGERIAVDRKLSALVNNAGKAAFGSVENASVETLRELMEINVVGPAALTAACLPELRRCGGVIVNIGSLSARLVPPFTGAYAASKAALAALSEATRREAGPLGVRVVLIEPGSVRTSMALRLRAGAQEIDPGSAYAVRMLSMRDRLRADAATGISPDTVAQAVVAAVLNPTTPDTVVLTGQPFRTWLRLCRASLRAWPAVR